MLPPQIQVIQMAKVKCNLVEHQNKSIKTLCLNPDCKESTTLCSKCIIKSHPQCRDHILELEDIPKQLTEFLQLQLTVVALQDKINNQFKELLSRIEQFLQPISKYQESPNLTNLDGVGLLLRKLPKQSILRSLNETNIKIRSLLDNQNFQEEKVSEEPSAEDWFRKGQTLKEQREYDKAIKCFEKAIWIDPNHYAYWYGKGQVLFCQSKYDEAIKCYEKTIWINPNHFWAKGFLSSAQTKLKEQQEKRG